MLLESEGEIAPRKAISKVANIMMYSYFPGFTLFETL